MMDHQEKVEHSIYRMILYNLLCFASVPVFIFGRQMRKVTGIKYQNPIMESCHDLQYSHYCELSEIGSKPETVSLLLFEQNITGQTSLGCRKIEQNGEEAGQSLEPFMAKLVLQPSCHFQSLESLFF